MNGHGRHTYNGTTPPPQEPEQHRPYQVAVSLRFLVTSLLASCLLAYCVGRAASLLLRNDGSSIPIQQFEEQECSATTTLPTFHQKHHVPQSRYLSKNFDTSLSASSSSWVAKSRDGAFIEDSYMNEESNDSIASEDDEEDDDDGPTAEHLMVDIRHVDASFLNSESLLVTAMLEVVKEADLTLMSYHCHGLTPSGVSCVALLRRNYISFHTWPTEGVITLDLVVGDGGSYATSSLVDYLPVIEREFGVSGDNDQNPETTWAWKARGFPEEEGETLDMQRSLEDLYGIKRQVSDDEIVT